MNLEIGRDITVSVKYKGTNFKSIDGKLERSKGRSITKIDHIISDNYYIPIYKILQNKIPNGYYSFTYSDGSLYVNMGAEEIDGTIYNNPRNIHITNDNKSKINYCDICDLLDINHNNVSKIFLSDGKHDEQIVFPEKHVNEFQVNHGMIVLDILNVINTDVQMSRCPSYEDALIAMAVNFFIQYLNNTKYEVLDILSDVPPFMKNTHVIEKSETFINNTQFTEIIISNNHFYDLFCFVLTLLRREKLMENLYIDLSHIKKFAKIRNMIANNAKK